MKITNKILIPGGTGFLGYHLCLFFKKKGWVVHSISKLNPQKKRKIKGVKYILCDVSDRLKLIKKLDYQYDYIVNLSGYVDHSKNKSIINSHYVGCKNLINIFKNRNLKKFVQIGSSIEYGIQKSPQKESQVKKKINTFSTYGNAKLLSTLFLKKLYKKEKTPITILRLYLVYGPNQDDNRVIPFVIKNSLKKNKFNCSPGHQLRDFTYIQDVILAIFKTFKSKKSNGEIINIGFGKPTKIRDLIIMIVKLIGSGKPIFSQIKLRHDELAKLYPSILKAKRILNWVPRTSLKKGMEKTIKFYKNK